MFGFIFSAISNLASRAIFFGLNLAANIWMRYWIRIRMAYQGRVVTVTNSFGSPPRRMYTGTNYPLLAFLILTPLALMGFGYFTGLLNYVVNFSLSFVFFFFNLFYFVVHTLIYVVLYIPVALFDFGLKYMSAVFDYGILAHLPFASHVPTLGSYVNGLNLIGLLNAFFYGAHAASMAGGNASFGNSFGLMSSPPTLGDFTWRPVTVNLNNMQHPINQPLTQQQQQQQQRSIWNRPITGLGGTVSGGTVSTGGGTSLVAIHRQIDKRTGGTKANYNPISNGGYTPHHYGSGSSTITDPVGNTWSW